MVPVLTATLPASADPGTILKFSVTTPVTGPYVGTANPIRTVPGGGLPSAGNANINGRVKLPQPCIAPIVFVASPTGTWFAATGS
jgi:hypothetical protein